jgi:hypothetical protein
MYFIFKSNFIHFFALDFCLRHRLVIHFIHFLYILLKLKWGKYQLVTVGYKSRVKIWKKQGFRIQFLTGLSYWKFDRAFVFKVWQSFRNENLTGLSYRFDKAFVLKVWQGLRIKNTQGFRIVLTGLSYWFFTRLSYRFWQGFRTALTGWGWVVRWWWWWTTRRKENNITLHEWT